jgi:hypothetical protein
MALRKSASSAGAAAVALALCFAAPAMASSAAARPDAAAPPAGPRLVKTHGCYGAVVNAPRQRGPVTPAEVGLPAAAVGFIARANAHHVRWLTTMTCRLGSHVSRYRPRHASPPAGSPRNTYSSGNWSGYQFGTTSGYEQSGWTVPTVGPSASGGAGYTSIWDGIGGGFGAGSGALIQSGTEQDYLSPGHTQYDAWYEVVGGTHPTPAEVIIQNMPVTAGQEWGGSGIYPYSAGAADLGVCNLTTDKCVSFSVPTSAPGNSTEWIVEAPSSSSGVLPLASFSPVSFAGGCWAATWPATTCSSIQSGSPTAIDMYQSGSLAAAPGAITNGSDFTVTYY